MSRKTDPNATCAKCAPIFMNQLVIFPTGTLPQKDRARLAKAGLIAVECDEPHNVVVSVPTAPMLALDDLLMSALHGISADPYEKAHRAFFDELFQRAKAREAKNP